MRYKLFTFFLALITGIGTLFAEVYSGTCGDDLNWSLDTETGALTITGTGTMTDWSNSSGMSWYSYRSSIRSVIIEDGVTSIGNYAFSNCTGLISVAIPESVTSIGNSAFSNCSGLTSVTIGNCVTSIGEWAFDYCSGLTSVTIGNSVTNIGNWAFSNCSGLVSVTIPNSVTSIGVRAFRSCSGLRSMTCRATTPPTCEEESFNGVNVAIPFYVPAESVNLYKQAPVWKEFFNVQVLNTEAIENVQGEETQTLRGTKTIKDGQVLILRGEKTYTVQGQEVK